MKKLLVPFIFIVVLFAMTGTAFASGWWVEYGVNSGDAGDTRATDPDAWPQEASAPWGNPNTAAASGTPSPHGGYSNTTNLCKTCHAVHNANNTSYRLLHDDSRMTECDYCHASGTGRSSHRPYEELYLQGLTVRGEHTPGLDPFSTEGTCVPNSTKNNGVGDPAETADCPYTTSGNRNGRLPDRGVGDRSQPGQGLYCFDCHSVHGADILTDADAGAGYTALILRDDPDGDGTGASAGIGGDTSLNAVRTAFCQGCHDLANGWDATAADDLIAGGGPTARPNPTSHVQGPAGNGELEIYGEDYAAANPDPLKQSLVGVGDSTTSGCRACHAGSGWNPGTAGDFPHQTQGHKLLEDGYTAAQGPGFGAGTGGPYESTSTATSIGDPRRPLDDMDFVCVQCHRDDGVDGNPGTADDTYGVGLSY